MSTSSETISYTVCCVCLFLANSALTWSVQDSNVSCRGVHDVFIKRVGSASHVPLSSISDATLIECSSTLEYTKGTSCCSEDMESKFPPASEAFLREQIRLSNSNLKSRITQSLHLYQEHLQLSIQEAQNKTLETLTNLYKIPQDVHTTVLDSFFGQLNSYLMGNDKFHLSGIVEDFFLNLFPVVFNYVLSDPSKPERLGEDFDKCLLKHYNEIQPFGNVPRHLGWKIKYGIKRARMYTEALEVMIGSIHATDNLRVHSDCKKALSRLQFCSMCSGEIGSRPCRGLCLNVMRGCLSGVSEISSLWDDLVVDFENLHLGMFRSNDAQELLCLLDGNVTDALMQAMDDGPRIFTHVMKLCREPSQSRSVTSQYKQFITTDALPLSHPSSRIHSIRKDITSLIDQLEESKGFFQRIADGLCRKPDLYDHEMQSEQCWNGSAVGRYIREVPEANVITQAKHNVEVKITLIPDPVLLGIKDTLAHMKRNLSVLYNEELMLSDQSYKAVAGSGGGGGNFNAARDIIDDDEDFADRNSGSGSGEGSDETEGRYDGDKSTFTVRPIPDSGRGHGSFTPGSGGGGRSGDGRDKGGRGRSSGSSNAALMSINLICVSYMLARIYL